MKANIHNTPSIFVIMGVTGDLAAKKIIPSLWHLSLHGLLPDRLAVIGFARRTLSDAEFENLVRDAVMKQGGIKVVEEDFSRFFKLFSYHSGTFEDERAFQSLASRIDEVGSTWGVCANKLFYLATPPSSYESIFKNLAAAKLNLPCDDDLGWSRLLVEKPFGTNLTTAKELQTLLTKYFKEEQIYRIDHYLFKEIIQGIENFRFSNNLFENTWDNTTIERIDIRLLESIGVESRGNFYDAVGALRDVGQNHLLAMLSAIAMEYPLGMETSTIHKNRTAVLEALAPWTDKTLREKTFRAEQADYKNIAGVAENSQTETYFALKTELVHSRWEGIPIYMEAGKRMAEARKEIVLTLKHPPMCLLCQAGPHEPNRIIFRLEPNDEIIIHFWTKKPGFERIVEERVFSFFLYEKETKVQYVEEYSKILHSAMMGDQVRFISSSEVEASWKFIDPIIDGWNQGVVPLVSYESGTTPAPKFFEIVDEEKKSGDQIGIIGLGKMGGNIARRLHSKKWQVVGFNEVSDVTKKIESEGILGAYSMQELVSKLSKSRTVWLMVPHQVVDVVLDELTPLLEKGDTVIDGGNSLYKESIRRSKKLAVMGINFLDIGVSGGPGGARDGACLMVGGKRELYEKYESLFKDISVDGGYGYMGESGAGHFVKMIHNGIEYGMMQAIGEGFEVMKKSPFSLDLHSVAEIYNHGSVITSRLVGWLADAYKKFSDELNAEACCSGKVSHSGEGQWTVDAAHEFGVPVKIIEGALEFRKQSQENPSYTGQVVSALRNQFGGHDTSNK